MPAAGGASRAPRLCARRRMRGRGGWAWGRASGRAVPHGAVCSRVSPPSSVVQVHASPPYTGVWNRARRPVGSSRGRAHTCTAGPGACTAVSDTVGRSGAQALVRKPLPVVSTSVFFCPPGRATVCMPFVVPVRASLDWHNSFTRFDAGVAGGAESRYTPKSLQAAPSVRKPCRNERNETHCS